MNLYRRLVYLLLALYLISGFTEAHAATIYVLVLETWPTTGHGLPGTEDIERILIPGFPDKETCRKYGQATQDAYPAPKDKHFTRHMLAWVCEPA